MARTYLWWKDRAADGSRWDRYAAYNSEEEALAQANTEDGLEAVKITSDEEGDNVLHDRKAIEASAKK
jgi:hypothetical protein